MLQGGSVLDRWWVMAWARQSAPNVVGARKLKALIFYAINPLVYEKRSLCIFDPLVGGLRPTHTVHLRYTGKPIEDVQ